MALNIEQVKTLLRLHGWYYEESSESFVKNGKKILVSAIEEAGTVPEILKLIENQ